MSAVPHWEEQPMLWDALRVGVGKGQLAPGIVRGLDITHEFDVDFKKGGGTNGETITINGEKLARVKIVLEIWNRGSHLERLRLFLALLLPKNGKPSPLDFVHPKLAYHGLRSLFVWKISDPTLPSEGGVLRLILDAANFKPPAPKPAIIRTYTLGVENVTVTPKTSKPTVPSGSFDPSEAARVFDGKKASGAVAGSAIDALFGKSPPTSTLPGPPPTPGP